MKDSPNIATRKMARELLNATETPSFADFTWDTADAHLRMAYLRHITFHPKDTLIPTLLKVLPLIPEQDIALRHSGKVALRECLKVNTSPLQTKTAAEAEFLFEVCLAVGQQACVEFVRGEMERKKVARRKVLQAYEYMGRHMHTLANPPLFLVDTEFADIPREQTLAALFRGAQAVAKTADGKPSPVLDLILRYFDKHPITGKDDWAGLKLILTSAKPLVDDKRFWEPYAQRCMEMVLASRVPQEQIPPAIECVLTLNPDYPRKPLYDVFRGPTTPLTVKEAIALGLAPSTAPQDRTTVLEFLSQASSRTATTLAASLAKDKPGAILLFQAIRQGKASPRLLQNQMVLESLKTSKPANWQATVQELTRGIPAADVRLAGLIKDRAEFLSRNPGDATRGKLIFTKNCAACHRVGEDGGKVGPNLDGIGTRGMDRLLEDTLDPNRNVDAAFRATRFEMKDGKQWVGLLIRTEGAVHILADAEGKEQRLPVGQVESQQVLAQSPMPSDVAERLNETEFADLMAYLLSVKAK
jgi:putative heme-binding domain-containing protein